MKLPVDDLVEDDDNFIPENKELEHRIRRSINVIMMKKKKKNIDLKLKH